MKLFVNFLLFTSFLSILSLATFYPISLMRVFSGGSFLVLGESTGPGPLTATRQGSLSGEIVSVSGRAYRGQNSYYNSAFQIENRSSQYQSYKVSVLKVYPLESLLRVSLSAKNDGVVTLSPGQSLPVGILVSESGASSGQPFDFTAKFIIIPGVNLQ